MKAAMKATSNKTRISGINVLTLPPNHALKGTQIAIQRTNPIKSRPVRQRVIVITWPVMNKPISRIGVMSNAKWAPGINSEIRLQKKNRYTIKTQW